MSTIRKSDWQPSSWQRKDALQQPTYADDDTLEVVLKRLRSLPPLVTSWEVENLKGRLAEATIGKRFLLQGGECAESLTDCDEGIITGRLKLLLQMSLVLIYGLRLPVVRVGRFAGQFAKPRSTETETRDGVTLPSYRGDMINQSGFTPEERAPDPRLMLDAYSHAAFTLNFVRALTNAGFADLHHTEYWNMEFVDQSPLREEYTAIVSSIREALQFMETVHEAPISGLERVEFFTSHEALLLPFEDAMTRDVPHQDGVYNLSTHFPWIGLRTAELHGAHVEYARGIANPIGMKVGPDMSPSDLSALVRALNPAGEIGRLTLITRIGATRIESVLPSMLEAVAATGIPVLWCCDPMHGNTEVTSTGVKTRRFDTIRGELELSFDIHRASRTNLGGVHFELTSEDVTECIGGARGLSEDDLENAYKSTVDPRLNGEQALEIAFSIVRKRRQMGGRH